MRRRRVPLLVFSLCFAVSLEAQRRNVTPAEAARLRKTYDALVAEDENCCNDFYERQRANIATWKQRQKAGEYADQAAADQDWQRMKQNLRSWKDEQNADYNARVAAYNKALRTGNADLVDVHPGYLIKYPYANARGRGPNLATADAATLGDQLKERDPGKVRAALATAQLRGLRLPPDDLALLLMRSREDAQVVQAARMLLLSDPLGGAAVLARHVMQERRAAGQLRELLGDDAARRVERARQIEPRRAALIQKAQAVTGDDPEGLAALERLAQIPGGDVGSLLERLAGDKSQAVADRAREALARRQAR